MILDKARALGCEVMFPCVGSYRAVDGTALAAEKGEGLQKGGGSRRWAISGKGGSVEFLQC